MEIIKGDKIFFDYIDWGNGYVGYYGSAKITNFLKVVKKRGLEKIKYNKIEYKGEDILKELNK